SQSRETDAKAPRDAPAADLPPGAQETRLPAALLESPASRPVEQSHGARSLRPRLLLLLPPQPAPPFPPPPALVVSLPPACGRPPGRRHSGSPRRVRLRGVNGPSGTRAGAIIPRRIPAPVQGG